MKTTNDNRCVSYQLLYSENEDSWYSVNYPKGGPIVFSSRTAVRQHIEHHGLPAKHYSIVEVTTETKSVESGTVINVNGNEKILNLLAEIRKLKPVGCPTPAFYGYTEAYREGQSDMFDRIETMITNEGFDK